MGAVSPLPKDLDLTKVDGVTVESRVPARVPLFGVALKNAPVGVTTGELIGVDEILLADGRVLFQCVQRPNGCGETFDTARGAGSHLARHRGRGAIRRYEEEITNLRAQVKSVQRSNQALRGAATRAQAAAAATTTANVEPVTAEAIRGLERTIRDGSAMVEQGLKIVSEAVNGALEMVKAAATDPEVQRKADAYDQLAALLPRQAESPAQERTRRR